MTLTHVQTRKDFLILIMMGVLSFALAPTASAEETYRPTSANLAAREWFQDAKFGLFIHFGPSSILADEVWVMNKRRIPVSRYEKLADFFNPVDFDAAEWVALAKAAGMKYITITSKQHDGFAIFGTKQSDWNIVDRTPYRKDLIKMLADECHRQGIKLFFYYSLLDWHHTDYYPLGATGRTTERPDHGDWNKYLDFMDAQLRELLTNYGEIGGIWFDGWWDKPKSDWRLHRTYALIHSLQPAALIGNNHHQLPFPGEDFQMWEKDLPGNNTTGMRVSTKIGTLPLETCETINGSWGFDLNDGAYKSPRELVQYLVRVAGRDANLLLDVGPMPNGKVQSEFVTRLQEVGRWMAKYGESIYGTRGGPITPRPWGVTTQKGNRVYVHILNWQDSTLALPRLPRVVQSATFLKDGSKAQFTETDTGLLLQLPPWASEEYDTIAVLELAQ